MIIFAAKCTKKFMNIMQINIKNIRDDFAATPNPFNQNLNYEKILRFSKAKVRTFLKSTNIFQKKVHFIAVKLC
jgi:hypothetical protein